MRDRVRQRTAQGETRSPAEGGLILVLALVALAINLRGPITALPPVVGAMRHDLGIGSAVFGLLTTIPVLCFGLLTPLASQVIARTTIETSIFVTLIGAGLGTLLRATGGIDMAIFGTVVLGAAATLGNIVSLLVIARDFPRSSPMMTGLYASSLNVGTMVTSAATAPLAGLFGWRIAIACWSCLAVLAIALWAYAFARHKGTSPLEQVPDGVVPESSLLAELVPAPTKPIGPCTVFWRRPLVWLLAIGFGCHVFMYYGLTAWLPAFLIQSQDMNASQAGLAASLFQITALLGSFGAPVLARRLPVSSLFVGVGFCWLLTPIVLLLAPGLWIIPSILGGAATGGGFTVTFMLVVQYAADLDDNRRISSLVQGVGYTVAAMGPVVLGVLHQQSGTWTSSLIVLTAAAAMVVTAAAAIWRVTPAQG